MLAPREKGDIQCRAMCPKAVKERVEHYKNMLLLSSNVEAFLQAIG
jgi:hypothetical protein